MLQTRKVSWEEEPDAPVGGTLNPLTICKLGCWCSSFFPALGRLRQEDSYQLESSLLYVRSARPVKATHNKALSQTKHAKIKKEPYM